MELKKGDYVGIISPSGFVEEKQIADGIKYLEYIGLKPVLGKHVYNKWRYMGGTPKDRAKDIMDFYKDKKIKALFCTRGGAGSQYVLDLLDYDIIKKNPKPLVGFSDTTALQNAITAKTKNINYSGFLLSFDFQTKLNLLVDKTLRDLLFGKKIVAEGGYCVHKGKAEGILVGGCLSVLSNLCGSPCFPDLSGKILVVEDIGGKSYQIDLMLNQLKKCKGFDKLKGIIFGGFKDYIIKDKEDGDIGEIIDEFCKDIKIPVIRDFLYSHNKARFVLPIGAKIKLDAAKCRLEY